MAGNARRYCVLTERMAVCALSRRRTFMSPRARILSSQLLSSTEAAAAATVVVAVMSYENETLRPTTTVRDQFSRPRLRLRPNLETSTETEANFWLETVRDRNCGLQIEVETKILALRPSRNAWS